LQVPKLKHYPVLAKGYAHFMIKFGWVSFNTSSRVCNKHHFKWLQICYTG